MKNISLESITKIDDTVIECIIESLTPFFTFSKTKDNKEIKTDKVLKEIVNLKTEIVDIKKLICA